MYRERTASAMARHWQITIDAALEAGETPVLEAGGSRHFMDSAGTAYALELATQQRTDPARPLLLAAHSAAFWPAALFAPQPFHARPAAAAPAVFYCGDDPAAGMACRLAWVDGLAVSPYSNHSKYSHLFDPDFLPHRHSGAPLRWETLPFAVLAHQTERTVTVAAPGAVREQFAQPGESAGAPHLPAPENSADWIGWAVLVAAIFLFLLAMVI